MLEIKNVTKKFVAEGKETYALREVNLTVNKGEIFGVIGMSGAGKSTLLRVCAGLERPDSGEVVVGGQIVGGQGKRLRGAKERLTGVVFQGYNLLQQKSVFENIAFPLQIAHAKKSDIEQKVKAIIGLVGLVGKEQCYPSQLSGGQKQRVAIARALVYSPEVLLLDEVTSALDPITTKQILELLKTVNKRFRVTMLFITHEMSVLRQVCDRVAVINYGKVEECGETDTVLSNPQSEIAKLLLGR